MPAKEQILYFHASRSPCFFCEVSTKAGFLSPKGGVCAERADNCCTLKKILYLCRSLTPK